MTITEFLEARIAEDEALARAAGHQKLAGPFHGNWRHDSLNLLSMERKDAKHIARHDPARVLAECAAKRAIIKSYASSAAARPNAAFGQRFVLAGMETGLEIAMKSLAAVYASHPDYDPRWVA